MELYDGSGNPSAAPQWISCSGGSFTLFIQSPNPIGPYTLDFGDGSAIVTGTDITPPAFVQHTYSPAVDTFIVTLTETSTGCTINGLVVMEEPVNASIQIPIGGVTSTCAPAALQFINSSTDVSPSTTFTWDFGDGSPIVTYNYTNAGQTVSHTYQQGTVNCQTQVTLTAQNYCSGGFPTVASFNPVQIWDLDDAQITASATLLCYPDTIVTFQNTTVKNCVPQGNTFQRYEYWNFGDYWGLGYDSIVDWQPYDPPARPGYTIGYPGIGSYTVMMIDSNYCGQDTAFITINIVPPPTAAIAANNDTVCAGVPITFFNLSTGGANSYSWNFGDGSGWITTGGGNQSHTFPISGDYTIQLAANITGGTASCTDTISMDVHILPRPLAFFSIADDNGCDSLTAVFTNASVNAVSWSWNFGNGFTSTLQNPPPRFYGTPGTYNVSLTVVSANGCSHTHTDQVYIYQTPVASFTPTNACEDEIAAFFDNSTSSPGDPIINWAWSFGDGGVASQQNPTHVFQNTGTFNVMLTATTANCSGTSATPVTVTLKPTAAFTANNPNGCGPLAVSFSNQSVGATSYSWNFGDGTTSTLTNPSHTFTNPTTGNVVYNVSLIVQTAAGCSDTITNPITVYPQPVAAFSSDAVASCAPMPVTFTNNSTGATSYQWNFGDGSGSTTPAPFHTYQNTTLFIQNYTVTLIAQSANGCTDTTTAQVVTYPEPQFGFNTVPDSGCSPLTVTFPSVIGAVVYQWDFGDGSTGTGPTPSHTYTNSTTNNVIYPVRLIATNPFGCVDTTFGQVLVNPNPTALFNVSSPSGCQPATVTFQNISTGTTNFLWNFGDGSDSTSSAASISHIYAHTSLVPQTYTITLTATTSAGCTDTVSHQVIVYPTVTADFTYDTAGCAPFPVTFINQTQGGSTFNWNFDDGFTDVVMNPTHTFTNTTTADIIRNVRMIATSAYGCRDTIFHPVTVHPTPTAGLTATPVSQVFPSATVTYTNNSSSGPWQYNWDFGDGATSTVMNPSAHTYATWGTFTINLITSSNYCSDTASQSIIIIPPIPISDFTGKQTGCKPVTVAFQNKSQYATSYSWNFGDGSTSNLENPIYTYSQPGVFTVSLTATGPGGISTTIHTDSIVVNETPTAYFVSNPKVVYLPSEPVTLFNLSGNADSYLWDFGDSTTSTDESPQHLYTAAGEYTITLIASTNAGCIDTFAIENAVKVEVSGEIVIPNAFTPNPNGPNGGVVQDGEFNNDVFHPITTGVTKYRLSIFNRWGELIFESLDPKIGWDGYYRDQLCQQDLYIWKVEAEFVNQTRIVKTGDVLLLR